MSLDIYFTHIVTLNPTNEQIMLLIRKLGLSDRVFHSLMSYRHINDITVTPKDMLSLVLGSINTSDTQEFYSKYSNFLYQYGNGIDFSSDLIHTENKIIVPSKEIIRGVAVVNNSLLRKAKEDPRIILSFSPREFEESATRS